MQNLTKRNKLALAIAGILVIAVIAVVAFNQVGGSQLSGTVVFALSPSNPTVVAGKTVTLSVPQVLGACSWSSSNTAVARVAAGACSSFSATVTGVAAGSATITVTYSVAGGIGGKSTATTTVTVLPAPMPTPTPTATPVPLVITVGADTGKNVSIIGFGERLLLCANDTTVRPENWAIVAPNPANAVTQLGSTTPGCIYAEGSYHGTGSATFRATNAAGRQGSVAVQVTDSISMSPANPSMTVGQSITMSMLSADGNSTWSIYKGCENLPAAS